jgi:hypothetical protein
MELHAIARDWKSVPILSWDLKTVCGNLQVAQAFRMGDEIVVKSDGIILGSWPSIHDALRGVEDRMKTVS